MQNIKVITVGTLKEAYHRAERDEYIKRLSAYCRLQRVEISAYKLPPEPTPAQIETALATEGEAIKRAVPAGAHVIALCVEGKRMSTSEFSGYLSRIGDSGKETALIIGSAWGLAESVKETAALRLSVSDFTFSHQMMQPLLYEILYRCMNLSHGGKYHK